MSFRNHKPPSLPSRAETYQANVRRLTPAVFAKAVMFMPDLYASTAFFNAFSLFLSALVPARLSP